ncbi:DNA adenine methylase [Helicobacter sp. L8]|uniref:DNA adenine methylase n=1 Tax=Helicobacter sp. L8 TaxID=2316078 RepID=UPI000EAD716E|nr:DNA adenine methylase [Helicobacter sp. L8]
MDCSKPLIWPGGKFYLTKTLLEKLPIRKYFCEVFAGGLSLLFAKQKERFEIVNDNNKELINFYLCARNCPQSLAQAYHALPIERGTFMQIAKEQREGVLPNNKIERAARFFYVNQWSYRGQGNGFRGGGGCPQEPSKRTYFRAIARLTHKDFTKQAQRLQRVIFACQDFEDFIKTYDNPQTFFYCDPPYIASADVYEDLAGNKAFSLDDHIRLSACLKNIQGKFLLSLDNHPLALELYAGFNIEVVQTTYSMRAGRSEMGAQELLISNYGKKWSLF